jgi:hypothetical protein
MSNENVALEHEARSFFRSHPLFEKHISLIKEDRFDVPNLVDLVQHGKARALTLYLGEYLIGEESELVALKEQHVPISFDLDEFRQLSQECFFDHLIEIIRDLLTPNQ